MGHSVRSSLASMISDFRFAWKELVVTDIAYKIAAFVVLTPLVGILFRFFIGISGRAVLADQDILFFFLGPLGWISLVVVGAVSITIIALEQAALVTIAFGATRGHRVGGRSALYFSAKHAWPVLQVTARMVAWGLLTAAPFLVAAAIVFFALLTKYDINYYLTKKPSEFWIAASLIVAIATGLAAVLIRVLLGWLFALPILLFEEVTAPAALRASRNRTTGHLRTIVLWIAGWFLATTALSAAGVGMVGLLGRTIFPYVTGSLPLLAVAVGAVLLVWGAINFIVTLLTSTTFAVLLVELYRRPAGRENADAATFFSADFPQSALVLRLSRRRLLGAATVAVVLAAAVGVAVLLSVRLEDRAEIMAHRGASGAAPENTLAAIHRAIADGADWVEIDVQETADGVVVVVHDSDLKKLAGVDLRIWEATQAELGEIDVGSWFAPEFRGERIPTLDELLAFCKGRIRVNIELKYYGHDERLEERVVAIVEKHAMQSEIVIMSLDHDAIRKVQSLRGEWKVGLLTAVAVGNLTQLDADFLAVNINLATRNFVRSAHRSGKEVYVWTVNDPVTISAMMGRGVDAVLTDEPALARSVLKQRARMSSPERLLVEVAALFGVCPEGKLLIDDF